MSSIIIAEGVTFFFLHSKFD